MQLDMDEATMHGAGSLACCSTASIKTLQMLHSQRLIATHIPTSSVADDVHTAPFAVCSYLQVFPMHKCHLIFIKSRPSHFPHQRAHLTSPSSLLVVSSIPIVASSTCQLAASSVQVCLENVIHADVTYTGVAHRKTVPIQSSTYTHMHHGWIVCATPSPKMRCN